MTEHQTRFTEDGLYLLLKRGREVTKSYLKQGHKMTMAEQFTRIHEEVTEAYKAFRAGDRQNLLEESSDIILATICLLDLLEVDFDEITHALENKLQLIEKRSGVKEW